VYQDRTAVYIKEQAKADKKFMEWVQPELYDVLLCLADVCEDDLVRQNTMQLLEVMPTDRHIVGQLTAVLESKAPCQGMRHLLIGSGVASKPARLLYTLQVPPAPLQLASSFS
jgi:hypothetical protein